MQTFIMHTALKWGVSHTFSISYGFQYTPYITLYSHHKDLSPFSHRSWWNSSVLKWSAIRADPSFRISENHNINMEGMYINSFAPSSKALLSLPLIWKEIKACVTCIIARLVYRIWSKWDDSILVGIYF